MITFLLTTSQINLLKQEYKPYIVPSNNQYVAFIIKGPMLLINVYKSNKVVFNKGGDVLRKKLALWQQNNQMNHYYSHDHMGSDEVGTGDFFGPIIVCAAFVKQDQFATILQMGVKDSKLLNDDTIKNLAPQLMTMIPHHILTLNNHKYNQIIKQENMNSIKAKLHNQAIKLLLTKVPTKNIIIDQFTTPKSFYNYFKNKKEIVANLQFHTKAEEKYLGVAIASIIARYYFLNEIERISQMMKTPIPLGASPTKINPLLKKFSHEQLNKIAKLNFKNYTR